MDVINIQNAKTHLSRLVEDALQGADIVIAKGGKPLVRLTPFQASQKPRKLGALAGKIHETSDCWDADPELEAVFYGSDEAPMELKVAEDSQ